MFTRSQPARLLLAAVVTLAFGQRSPSAAAPRQESTKAKLFNAVIQNDIPAAKATLRRGEEVNEVNARDANERTPLMLAVERGNLLMVRFLLSKGADPHLKSKDGRTALSRAVEKDHTAILKALLEVDSRPGFVSYTKGMPPLVWAALLDDVATVKALIARGVNPKGREANLAVAVAAGYNRAVVVSFLLSKGADPNSRLLRDGETPLMAAAAPPAPHQDKIVQLLLNHGARIDDQDRRGQTAVMKAVEQGNGETLRVLLDRGARLGLKDKEGRTAAMQAKEAGQTRIVAMLQRKATNTENARHRLDLIRAVERGDVAATQALLAGGADVNARDDAGDTVLMKAAAQGQAAVAKLLLAHGAAINLKSLDGGFTALFYAVDHGNIRPLTNAAADGHTEVIQALLANGADLNVRTDQGTALFRAAILGPATVVQALLDHGAAVDGARDDVGETPLMAAAQQGHGAIVTLLLNRDAALEARDREGGTALMGAANNGFLDVVRILLARGADVNAKQTYGTTALWMAAEQGNTEIVKLLLESGAVVDAENQTPRDTPLIAAALAQQTEIVRLLLAHGADVNRRDRGGKTAMDYAVLGKNTTMIRLLKEAGAR